MNIIQAPQDFSTLANPLYLVVNDSSSAVLSEFRYIVDIEIAGQTTRLKLNPHPNNGYGVVDLREVVSSYVDVSLPPISQVNNFAEVDIMLGYEYVASSGIVQEVLDEEDYDFTVINSTNKDSSDKVLTNAPDIQTIGEDEYAYLAYGDASSSVGDPTVTYYNENGGSISSQTLTVIGTDYLFTKVGTADLNVPANTTYYVVKWGGESYRYNIGYCGKFKNETVRVHFENSYGAWDSFTFTQINRKFLNRETQQVETSFDQVTSSGVTESPFNGTRDFHVEVTNLIVANSKWLTQKEYDWLVELFRSKNVLLEKDGWHRARVRTNTIEHKKKEFDKLIQLQIEISYND